MPEPSPAPSGADFVLSGAHVLTCDDAMRVIENGAVAVAGERIAAVGTAGELCARFPGVPAHDLTGHILTPGLVNAHAHAPMSVFRGLADDLPLHEWLFSVIFPAEAAHMTPEAVYHGALLSCAEMLLSGTTTFCDGYFFEEEVARAAIDSGIRAVCGQGILDFPSPDVADPSQARRRAEEFLSGFPPHPRVSPSIFCHACSTCAPATLLWGKALAREAGVLFQIHLSETRGEVEEVSKVRGARPGEHLARLGVLDSMTLCAHGVWLEGHEIAALSASGASVAHCPESNMKLASGVAPVSEMLAAGVTVALGTDGAASNNDLDLVREMRTAALLQKAFRRDPTALPAKAALRMATRGGAGALGLSGAIGSIEPGKYADLAAFDARSPRMTPLHEPHSQIVYAATGTDVRHVWVSGARVVADGRLATMDAGPVMDAARRIAGGVSRRH